MNNSISSSDKKNQTIKYYQQNAEEWARAHHGYEESYWHQEIQQLNRLLPKGKILEIGCGPGRDAEALINLGYDYTGIDPSPGLLKIARKRNREARFIKTSVDKMDFQPEKFDGFFTAATLLHIPKNEIDKTLQKIKAQIKPGGIGFISLAKGEAEEQDNHGRWYFYYSRAEFKQVLERNGYVVIDAKTRQGTKRTWLCFWVKINF